MPRIYYKDEHGVQRPCEVLDKSKDDTYRIMYLTKDGRITRLVTRDRLVFPQFKDLVY